MAEKNIANTPDPAQLEQLAFRLFADRSGRIVNRSAEVLAVQCFADAEKFLGIAAKIRAGEPLTKKPTGPQLSDCSAPNLKPTHPLNMVSQRFGDPSLMQVRKLHARIEKDPTLEAIPELDWGKAEVNTARAIFPAYAAAN